MTWAVTRAGRLGLAALALGFAVAGCGSAPHAGGPGGGGGTSAPPVSPPVSPVVSPSCGRGTAAAGNSAGTGLTLNAVQFVSPQSGWVVGSDRILHTADGGAHWVTQYRTPRGAQLAGVDFTDSLHGWVTGASTILATADGGAHWHALPEPCQPVRAVHFVTPSLGFAVAGGSVPVFGGPASGGILLSTTDGGQRWQALATPRDVQSACFSDPRRGWLGAAGSIYGTADGGRTWTLAVRGPRPSGGPASVHAIAQVQCAAGGAAWAQVIGPGAAMSHVPQIGYHTSGGPWRPIFAEQYTAGPGLRTRVRAQAPGVEPGPFSAVSAAQAVFAGYCAPCSAPSSPQLQGTAPVAVATDGGARLLRPGVVPNLSQATGIAFISAQEGWVVGTQTRYPKSGSGSPSTVSRILRTADGGRSWQVQYTLPAAR